MRPLTKAGGGQTPGSRPSRRAAAWCAWILAASALRCESDADPGEPLSAGALCAGLAELTCAARASCCAAPGGGGAPDGGAPDAGATCFGDDLARCEASLGRYARTPRVGYDPARGRALVNAVRAAVATCGETPPPWSALRAAFAGTGVAGADCTPSSSARESLALSAMSCAAGAACRLYLRSNGGVQGTCEARTDDACSHPYDCPAGQWCNLPDEWSPGTWARCQPLRVEGWSCGSDLQCASLRCVAGACAGTARGALCDLTYRWRIVEARPVAYLRLGDLDRAAAVDASGRHRDGLYAGDTARAAQGALASDDDGALRLDGVGGHARLPAIAALAAGTSVSLEVWIRPDSTGAARPVVAFAGADGAPGVSVWMMASGSLVADLVGVDGASHSIRSADGLVEAGAWRHVVLTLVGGAGRLYVDGVEVGQTAVAGPVRVAGEVVIGRETSEAETLAESFAGTIDEVALYDRALTAEEVAAHHGAALAMPAPRPYGLYSWLP